LVIGARRRSSSAWISTVPLCGGAGRCQGPSPRRIGIPDSRYRAASAEFAGRVGQLLCAGSAAREVKPYRVTAGMAGSSSRWVIGLVDGGGVRRLGRLLGSSFEPRQGRAGLRRRSRLRCGAPQHLRRGVGGLSPARGLWCRCHESPPRRVRQSVSTKLPTNRTSPIR
jgi:hypothetical protein